MSEAHHPLTNPRSISALVIELVMISFAVYLGVFAEQWREERHQNELARQALSNFRAEILTNRKAITDWKDYHAKLLTQVKAFNTGRAHDPKTYQETVEFNGIHLINFEHTAWDLALATQAVAHIEPELAFRVSRLYTRQASFQNEENSFLADLMMPASYMNVTWDVLPMTISLENYLADVTIDEPEFVRTYDELIPDINVALGLPKN